MVLSILHYFLKFLEYFDVKYYNVLFFWYFVVFLDYLFLETPQSITICIELKPDRALI